MLLFPSLQSHSTTEAEDLGQAQYSFHKCLLAVPSHLVLSVLRWTQQIQEDLKETEIPKCLFFPLVKTFPFFSHREPLLAPG